jgi:dUTP pyrophosphatase
MKIGELSCHPTLYVYMDPDITDESTIDLYRNRAYDHNVSVLNDSHPNSGFDIFFPKEETFFGISSKMVNFGIKCEMKLFDTLNNQSGPTGFYLYPRSSISKTPLMLANQTGIIDSGYRGHIIGAFRILSTESWSVSKHDRLLQICAPTLEPFLVQIVESDFFNDTTRGTGGFGSTGR